MLTITRKQYETLSKNREQRFIARAVEHLRKQHPDWCDTRDDNAIAAIVVTAMAFAREHGVTHEANVLRLLNLQIWPGFAVPLSGYLYYRLTQREFDESTRVRNFAFALTQPQWPLVVALDTDLDSLERNND